MPVREIMQAVAGVVLLGRDGARLLSSYAPEGALGSGAAQTEFEEAFVALVRGQYESAKKGTHVATVGELVVLFTLHPDFCLAVAAGRAENVLFLRDFVEALAAALSLACGKDFSLKALQRHYCEAMLVLDAAIDRGLPLSTSAEEMLARAMMQDFSPAGRTPPARSAIKGLFSLMG